MATKTVTAAAALATNPSATGAQREATRLEIQQAATIFGEIADLANQTDRSCYWSSAEFMEPGMIEAERALIEQTRLREIIKRLGWLGDLGHLKLTGATVIRGGAEAWLLPPVYPRDASEVTHG